MYKLKNVATRGSALVAAASLLTGVGTSMLPAFAHADALNPLTNRSLTLSSSSPGWSYTDGSGNGLYAPPNSGANGQKTGETFSFNVSSTATIKAYTFQYCTTAAGSCYGPGNDTQTLPTPRVDDGTHSDLNVVTSSPTEISSANWTAISASASGIPPANDTQGNFVVLANGAYSSNAWTMTRSSVEDTATTGKYNYITLKSSAGGDALTAGENVKVIFFGTNGNYITNPGSGAFFVKINDYNSDTTQNNTTLVDGGVTVANVMNQSIEIQTKVLETMDFSVGTVDPDTLASGAGSALATAYPGHTTHGSCDPILTSTNPSTQAANTLTLGNTSAEDSLDTHNTFATHSYWRLSSNSSGGATVYYSGNTLSDTENDHIAAMGSSATPPVIGTPQFGLALDNGSSGTYGVNYTPASGIYETGADGNPSGVDASFTSALASLPADTHATPQLAPLVPTANYGGGTGGINTGDSGGIATNFAFNPNANTIPVPIASESSQVVDCVTGKMRYVGNIAATTPAGIYTTKINYVASPQY